MNRIRCEAVDKFDYDGLAVERGWFIDVDPKDIEGLIMGQKVRVLTKPENRILK